MKSLSFFLFLLPMTLTLPVFAADTGTVSALNQVNTSPWGMDPSRMSASSDPHPDTSAPQSMTGTMADTQFGRGVPSGSSQVKLLDATTVTRTGDFQSVVNRISSTGSVTGRINQLQTQINQNQSQAGYIFDEKFGITSVTDGSGNLVGQATGTFVGTMTENQGGGKIGTVTCTGTFTYDSTQGYTLTAGSQQVWKGPGCVSQ